MNWKHGYYADAGYTYGYYPETMPLRLRWAALIQGHAAPEKGFRYLDAGCGQGLNLILAAAAHPDSEFVGIDFLPEHIAHSTDLAARCGLRNVRFIEGDFVALAADPAPLGGSFDYAVCHGITTWIAPPVKEALFRLVGQALKPGGVFYNSYNTYPGWLAAAPFQHLVLLEQRSKSGKAALDAARTAMTALEALGGGVFSQLPSLKHRMASMAQQDPAYLVQEYNNQYWQPVFFSRMADELGAVKLSYLGTATLPEAFDNALPAAMREWILGEGDVLLRETRRDYALNQSFRRDLYVKGPRRLWPSAQQQALAATRFVSNPTVAEPEAGAAWAIKGGTVELKGDAAFYSALMARLKAAGDAGASLGELAAQYPDAGARSALLQALSLMVHAGWAVLLNGDAEAQKRSSRNVNAAMTQAALEGAPYLYVSLPRSGTACQVSETDWMMLSLEYAKKPEASWATELAGYLRRAGRNLVKDGQPVTDETTTAEMLNAAIQSYRQGKRVLFRRLGAI